MRVPALYLEVYARRGVRRAAPRAVTGRRLGASAAPGPARSLVREINWFRWYMHMYIAHCTLVDLVSPARRPGSRAHVSRARVPLAVSALVCDWSAPRPRRAARGRQ